MPGLHGQALPEKRKPDLGCGVGVLVPLDQEAAGVAFLLRLPGLSFGAGLLVLAGRHLAPGWGARSGEFPESTLVAVLLGVGAAVCDPHLDGLPRRGLPVVLLVVVVGVGFVDHHLHMRDMPRAFGVLFRGHSLPGGGVRGAE